MKESKATELLITKYGPVNAMRLLGWAWKAELEGEDWIREKVSRQQFTFIQGQFADAGVPWGQGTIEWPSVLRAGKKAVDDAKALNARTQEAARLERRGRRTT